MYLQEFHTRFWVPDTKVENVATDAKPQFNVKEKALLSLALAKHLLQIQESWKVRAGAERKRQGLTPKGLADAAVSWPALLLELVSWSTQEGVFQVEKLVLYALSFAAHSLNA